MNDAPRWVVGQRPLTENGAAASIKTEASRQHQQKQKKQRTNKSVKRNLPKAVRSALESVVLGWAATPDRRATVNLFSARVAQPSVP